MAFPVINSVVPASSASAPIVFTPGQTQTVTVTASDPDTGPAVSQVLNVQDSVGNITPVTVTLKVTDPLTFSAGVVPAGWLVTGGGSVGSFSVKAP